jgi:hypothetical protein
VNLNHRVMSGRPSCMGCALHSGASCGTGRPSQYWVGRQALHPDAGASLSGSSQAVRSLKKKKAKVAASRSCGRATAAAVGPLESWCYPPPSRTTPELTRALRRTARGKRGRRARADRPRSTAPCSRRCATRSMKGRTGRGR